MNTEIEVNEHKAVGPVAKMYGHGPVTAISPEYEGAPELFICLDCGYTCRDNRMLAHEECDRADNGIVKTWREYLDAEDLDNLPEPDEDSEWPIED